MTANGSARRYSIHNPHPGGRVVFDGGVYGALRAIEIRPKETRASEMLMPDAAERMRRSGLVITEHPVQPPIQPMRPDDPPSPLLPAAAQTTRQALAIRGMYGIGDNLHQRAILRELMKTYDVWLESCHFTLYHDLIEQGLKVTMMPTRLRAQAKTLAREMRMFHGEGPPGNALRNKIWYNKPDIDKHGSILESMFGTFDIKLPVEKMDFSLPLKDDWKAKARTLVDQWKKRTDKPILIFRHIVQRKEWDGSSRNPDPAAYYDLYQHIRDRFFVVSIADLAQNAEWIVGSEQDTDVQFHRGELDFGVMAALFAEASMVMSPAGFAPVLAQAVGTPIVAVYGGRESYRTTERAGAHLAPTLGINPINPCDCHSHHHKCNKTIDVPLAKTQLDGFVAKVIDPSRAPRVLIFATTYVDNADRARLTDHWVKLHRHLNPRCDLLLVDSASPHKPITTHDVNVYDFGNNVGHLSRGGRDGWGRAFSYGLQAAIDGGYDYVVHIEGDSLFRLPVMPIVEEMKRDGVKCMTTPVKGMRMDMPGWIETGLMFFDVDYLRSFEFVKRYDWQKRRSSPTPEVVIATILGASAKLMPWKALRGDKNQITHTNVLSLDLDWVTHAHRDVWVYDRFVEAAMGSASSAPAPTGEDVARQVATVAAAPAPRPPVKLNFGCGTNKLPGWQNYDAEVDIEQKLPFENSFADFIFAEHVVEHVDYYKAIDFFREAFRVLRPGGRIRITVPSIEQIMRTDSQAYFDFSAKFHPGGTKRSAMHAILYCHGHETAWTRTLLETTLFFAGFEEVKHCATSVSDHAELRNVEGHHKVIGVEFNGIESLSMEGLKPIVHPSSKIGVVVGGAECAFEEVNAAEVLLAEAGAKAQWIVVNDMIAAFPGECIAASLHPDKLAKWLKARAENGYPAPIEVWSHREHKDSTHHIGDWSGSSGLFGTRIMLHKGMERVILCGVPMSLEGGHFVRKAPWGQHAPFLPGWHTHRVELKHKVRSFSGFTANMLGKPDVAFLQA